MKKIILSVGLISTLMLYSCVGLYAIGDFSIAAGHFRAGRYAEENGDFVSALEHYKKASAAYRDSAREVYLSPGYSLPPGYAPSDLYGRATIRFTSTLISDGIRRVEAAANTQFQRLYAQTTSYTINGRVRNTDDKPLANIIIAFRQNLQNSREVREYKAQTNNEGYFTLPVVGSGKLIVKVDEWDPFLSPVSLDVNPLINGEIEANNSNYNKGEIIAIVPPASVMGKQFDMINHSYGLADYDKVLKLGHSYLSIYGNQIGSRSSDVDLMTKTAREAIEVQNEKKAKEKMFSAFNAILDFNKADSYNSVITSGKDYIDQYRDTKSSRWHEIEQFVREAKQNLDRIDGEVQSAQKTVERLYSEKDYEGAISVGAELLNKYSNVTTPSKGKFQVTYEQIKSENQVMKELKKLYHAAEDAKDYKEFIKKGNVFLEANKNKDGTGELQQLVSEAIERLQALIADAENESQKMNDDWDWFLAPEGTKKEFEVTNLIPESPVIGKTIEIISEVKNDRFGDKIVTIIDKFSMGGLSINGHSIYKIDYGTNRVVQKESYSEQVDIKRTWDDPYPYVVMALPLTIGKAWRSYSYEVSDIKTMEVKLVRHERKLVGKEKIKLPAGEFEAIVIIDEKGNTMEYYAKGIGLVATKMTNAMDYKKKKKTWYWAFKLTNISKED